MLFIQFPSSGNLSVFYSLLKSFFKVNCRAFTNDNLLLELWGEIVFWRLWRSNKEEFMMNLMDLYGTCVAQLWCHQAARCSRCKWMEPQNGHKTVTCPGLSWAPPACECRWCFPAWTGSPSSSKSPPASRWFSAAPPEILGRRALENTSERALVLCWSSRQFISIVIVWLLPGCPCM